MGIFSRKKTATPVEPAAQAATVTPAVQKTVAKVSIKADALLLQPMVTEKATVTGTYIFKVVSGATKNEVSKAFKAKYGKTPRKVNMMNVMGKTKLRGRQVGKRSDWKKAIVYLTKGETVDLYQ